MRDVQERESEFIDRLVHINRVAKVVKGGKRFGFAALVVVGDQKGRVGFGHGKAREVPEAIRKATEQAKRQLIRVPLREARTLHHDVTGRHGAGIAGAPKAGDKAAWGPRIAKGTATLYDHAIHGFQGTAGVMPAKGGRTDAPDDLVKQAVDYMVGLAK